MAGNKFLKLSSGQLAEELSLQSSVGAGDAGKIVALDAAGRIDNSMMPIGIGADTKSIASSENLAAGDLVNIYDNGGTINCRKADASNGRRAHGFVLASVTSPANATVYFEGTITGLTGLTPGATLYLSGATAGAVTATAPSTPAHIVQEIGAAASATEVTFEPQQPITLA